MSNHLVMYRNSIENIYRLAKEAGFELENKKLYIIDIKYITPNRFHPAIWKKNWMFAYDILTSGELFDEMYILIIDELQDLRYLHKEQINVIKENAIILTQ